MNREEMLARMAAILAAAEAADKRALTEAEQTEFDDLTAKVEALDSVAAAAADRERRAAIVARFRSPSAPTQTAAPAPAASSAVIVRPGSEQPKAFENIGEFFHAALLAPQDPRLATLWREPSDPSRSRSAEQRMDTGSLGGFMVPEQFVSTIREVPVQGALIRPRANVIPAGSPPDAKITFPYLEQGADSNVYGGVAVDWVEGEGGTKPGTTGNLGVFSLQPNEWAGVLTVTDKLLRNWSAASAYFTQKIREAASAFEDTQFFRLGTGSGRPLSILNSGALITVESSGGAGTVSFADVVNMMAQHMVGPSSVWSISRSLYASVVTLRNDSPGDGSLIFVPGNITAGIPDSLMGIPIYWNDRAPAAATVGSFALLNLAHYMIKDGSGPFVVSDGGIVNFSNNKTLVKVFGNVDGQPDLKEPFTLEGGYQVSPFVVLNTAA